MQREGTLSGWKNFGTVVMTGFLLMGTLAGGQSAAKSSHVKKKAGAASSSKATKTAKAKGKVSGTASSAKGAKGAKGKAAAKGKQRAVHTASRKPTAQTIRLTQAFVATEQLRPMAQQLASTRSAAAYAGVEGYARQHPGEGAAAAYLSLGHAYMQDKRFSDAAAAYRQANVSGTALDDYADYLGAQAAIQAGRGQDAYTLLDRFAERHPESIFVATAPVLLAQAHLQQSDPQGGLKVLTPLAETAQGGHADFRYMLGRAYQMAGDTGHAGTVFRRLYVSLPLSPEAAQAKTQLQAMGVSLSASEQKVHADQLFNAKRYAEASAEYHAIDRNGAGLSSADHDALLIYEAACDLKLKHLSRGDAERLPNTADDSAALKMYLLAEISRNEKDEAGHDVLIEQMVQRFPHSRWLEEALYSGGNMYLLKHDAKQATYHYSLLVKMFPGSTYAASAHWRTAWMNYRTRNYTDAARLMDEQIEGYPGGAEVPTALYWRGRIYEEQEHNFGQAANYYRTLIGSYVNYYYSGLARQRLNVLKGQVTDVAPAPALKAVKAPDVPFLTGELPENEPHLIKARLLANAALNEYISPEIQASPTANEWGALAQGEIFSSYGEHWRALQAMKKSGISFFAIPLEDVPTVYWKLAFPQPFWSELMAQAQRNNLDPFLVASLIRQETEFNPGAISRANAWGLMQLLPTVGKAQAKKAGRKGFNTNELLNPAINLELGTANLRQVLDRFGGQIEYTLAAYNAGDTPVRQWMSSGDYKDMAEFVESIPYTETREYVQAILRNREIYRELYGTR